MVETLIGEQFRGKAKLIEPNLRALRIGYEDAKTRFECPLGIRIRRSDKVGDRILVEGNFAAGARRGLWRRDRLRVVSDHALDFDRRSLREALRALAGRSRDRRKTLRDRAGRGRDRRHRHGDRRGLERRARVHRDLGPGHFADAGVPRPRLFRRNPRGHFRRPARRPLDRNADAHATIRHSRLRLRLAWGHQACAAAAGGPERGVRIRRARLRLRRAAGDAGLRDARSRHRHEFASGARPSPGTTRASSIAAR